MSTVPVHNRLKSLKSNKPLTLFSFLLVLAQGGAPGPARGLRSAPHA